MKTEQDYIDAINSINTEIEFWNNYHDNFIGKHGSWGRSNRNNSKEKIEFFTEQKVKLKKEFQEFLLINQDISKIIRIFTK